MTIACTRKRQVACRLLLALCFWSTVAIVCISASSEVQTAELLDLRAKSFSSKTTIKTVSLERGSQTKEVVQIEEFYSGKQRIFKLRYTQELATNSGPSSTEGELYYDVARDFWLKVERDRTASSRRPVCSAGADAKLKYHRLIYGNSISIENWLGPLGNGSPGSPIALLLTIDRYVGGLKKCLQDQAAILGARESAKADEVLDPICSVERSAQANTEGSWYEPKYTKIHVRYKDGARSAQRDDDQHSNKRLLPYEIHMEFREGYTSTRQVIEYTEVVPIEDADSIDSGATSEPVIDGLIADTKVEHDQFILPLGAECSRALQTITQRPLVGPNSEWTGGVSFEAAVTISTPDPLTNASNNVPMLRFTSPIVAYDRTLGSMRIDTIPAPSRTKVLRKQFDFPLNRAYHVLEKVEGSSTSFIDQVLDAGSRKTPPGSRQCVVARVWEHDERSDVGERFVKYPPTGRLVTGANWESFVYMGKARVQGIRTRVYRAVDRGANLPLWLEQPFAYKTLAGKASRRGPEWGAEVHVDETETTKHDEKYPFTITLYSKDDDSAADSQTSSLPFMIEITKLDPERDYQLVNKWTITFARFAWDLSVASSRSLSLDREKLFALDELCSARDPQTGFAKQPTSVRHIVMSLRSEAPLNAKFKTLLSGEQERNAALRAGLRASLRLPTNMIYELASELLPGMKQDDGEQILLQFKVAEHTRQLAEPIYLGLGHEMSDYAGAKVKLPVNSFGDCLFLAAHRRSSDIQFAYNNRDGNCLIDLKPHPKSMELKQRPKSGHRSLSYFALGSPVDEKRQQQALEVYWLNQLEGEEGNWANGTRESMSLFEGEDLIIPGTWSGEEAKFKMESIFVDHHGDSESTQPAAANIPLDEYQSEVLPGTWTLIEDEPGNRRVALVPLDPFGWKDNDKVTSPTPSMTLKQCRMACLLDAKCQSFSFCRFPSDAWCVVSQTSFETLKGSLSYYSAVQSSSKNNSSSPRSSFPGDHIVTVDPWKLIKDSDCRLYQPNQMSYGKFFERVKWLPRGEKFIGRKKYTVESGEQCASFCFEQSRSYRVAMSNLLRADSGGHSWTLGQIANERERPESIGDIFGCDESFYLHQSNYYSSSTGHCVLGRAASENERAQLATEPGRPGSARVLWAEPGEDQDLEKRYASFEKFIFKTESFFEQHRGIMLRGTQMTSKQRSAYTSIRVAGERRAKTDGRQEISGPSFAAAREALRPFVEQGGNVYGIMIAGEKKCALNCLNDWLDPWPACRSFSLALKVTKEEVQVYCQLNSITLRQAIASHQHELVHSATNETFRYFWHYDPHPGLFFDESDASQQQETTDGQPADERGVWAEYRVATFKISPVGLQSVIVFAILCGLVSGIWFGRQALTSWQSLSLVEQPPIDLTENLQSSAPLPTTQLSDIQTNSEFNDKSLS